MSLGRADSTGWLATTSIGGTDHFPETGHATSSERALDGEGRAARPSPSTPVPSLQKKVPSRFDRSRVGFRCADGDGACVEASRDAANAHTDMPSTERRSPDPRLTLGRSGLRLQRRVPPHLADRHPPQGLEPRRPAHRTGRLGAYLRRPLHPRRAAQPRHVGDHDRSPGAGMAPRRGDPRQRTQRARQEHGTRRDHTGPHPRRPQRHLLAITSPD